MADNDFRPDPELDAALHRVAASGGSAARPWAPDTVRALGERRHRRRAAGVVAGTALGLVAAGGIAYGSGALGQRGGPANVATTASASPSPSSAATRSAAPSPTPPATPTPHATRIPPPQGSATPSLTPSSTPSPTPSSTATDITPPVPGTAFLTAAGMPGTLGPWRVTTTGDNTDAQAAASRCQRQRSPDRDSHAYERDFASGQQYVDGAELIVPSADSAAAETATARLTRWFTRCLTSGQAAGQTGDSIIDEPLDATYGPGARVVGLTFPSADVPNAVPAEYAAYGRGGPDGDTVVLVIVHYTGQDVLDPMDTVVKPLRQALARLR